MHKAFLKYLSPLFLMVAGSAQASDASANPVQAAEPALYNPIAATVDVRQTGAPVSKYEYGMFIEHLGSLVYGSLWSEMIDDRKFFFPIVAKNAEEPAGGDSPFRQRQRKWIPIGSDSYISMDRQNPFVGEQSPCITLNPAEPRGMRETGMTLVKGKAYEGRVYLRATPGTEVTVSLVWGNSSNDRQKITIQPTDAYGKYPLAFTAGADASNASLEITAVGNGTLHVGAASLMPSDNVNGFRPDVIALLKDLHSGMWRLPGGNVISAWSWYDSVGDIDSRPPYFDPVWNALQSNDVGMDEFMTLCRLLEVEPYISVNAGFGDAHSAAEEVEYMNGNATTRMGALRAKNGHCAPYGVRFWDIGNEPYGSWQFGRTDLKYYVYKHNDFAKAMRKVDPSITLLASGSMPDRLWADPDKPVPYDATKESIGDEVDWTGGLFAHCMDNFDGMTEHWYAPSGMKYDPEHAPKDVDQMFAGFVPMEYTTLEWIRYPSNRVRVKAEQWEQYRKLFPGIDAQKKFLSIDEYAFLARGNNLKTALAQGMIFNEMLRYTDFLKMSAFTMGTSTLDITPTQAAYNANGLVFKLYRDELGDIPVTVFGNSPQPAPKFKIDGDQPRVNAGSPTYPLDMVATLTADRKFLVLSVVNATDKEQSFDLNLLGAKVTGKPALKLLTGPNLEAANHAGKPAEVVVRDAAINGDSKRLGAAPYSISIYRIPVTMEK
jgi:alpha-L-arabinofuranosidase